MAPDGDGQQHGTGDVEVERPVGRGDDRRAEFDSGLGAPEPPGRFGRVVRSIPVLRVGDLGEPSPVRRRPVPGERPEQLGQHWFPVPGEQPCADESPSGVARGGAGEVELVGRRRGQDRARVVVVPTPEQLVGHDSSGPPDDPDRHRPLAWFHDVHACVDPDAGRTKEQPPRREIEVAPTRFPERNLGRLVDPVGDDQHQPVG